MARVWAGIFALLTVAALPAVAFERVSGSWDTTLQLFPTIKLYQSFITLELAFAGWSVESETKIYSSGWRYQNFYLDGSLGDWDVWGKIYFDVQNTRYEKLWLDFETAVGEGTLFFGLNHWASRDDYSSGDEDRFGPWPCDVVTWDMLLPWDQDHEDQYKYEYLHVQGPVASYYPNNPSSYVTLNVGAPWPNDRFQVYITGDAFDALKQRLGDTFWVDLVGETICVYGQIIEYSNLPEIKLDDAGEADDLVVGTCCGTPGALGPLMIYRGEFEWAPLTVTLDFADCCSGIQLKQAQVALDGVSLCCGVTYDAKLAFSKCHGFESLQFSLYDVFPICCGISFDISVEFTSESKVVSITPFWEGIEGCFELYGNVDWDAANFALEGLEIYGFGITCYFDGVTLTSVSALNPDKVEDMTDVSFYSGEFEYLGLEYEGTGCYGGDVTFSVEFWFGKDGILFDVQRTKYYLDLPISASTSLFIKGQWDFSDPSPLDWFDVGWKISF